MVDSKWLQRLQEDASNFTEGMATDLVLKVKNAEFDGVTFRLE